MMPSARAIGGAVAEAHPPITALRELAPTGPIRVAINTGNPVLARKGVDGGDPTGVSVDIAREVGRQCATPVVLVSHASAGDVFAALEHGEWDMAFLAIEPVRAERIAFTAPYLQIEGTCLVRRESPLHGAADLDRPGTRIAVTQGAAYDLFLTRTLRHAEIVRLPDGDAALACLAHGDADAVAGIRQALDAAARRQPEVRVLADPFMQIEQAIAVPKSRHAAAAWLRAFLDETVASGFIARTLDRNR